MIFNLAQSWRKMHCPICKAVAQSRQPFTDTGFTSIDLLTATYQTNHHRPIWVPVHTRNQKLRLGLLKAGYCFLASHKARSLLQVPSPLRFIKESNMLNWRLIRVSQAIITKVMNVLNEHLHFAARFT